jgi:hypothetical protein
MKYFVQSGAFSILRQIKYFIEGLDSGARIKKSQSKWKGYTFYILSPES